MRLHKFFMLLLTFIFLTNAKTSRKSEVRNHQEKLRQFNKPQKNHQNKNPKKSSQHNQRQVSASFRDNQKQQETAKHEVIMVVGGPGSGKGTLCTELLKEFNFIHISTGDLLRKFPCDSSFLSYYYNYQMSHAYFVKTQLLVALIKMEFQKYNQPQTFLLDGYPRNEENVRVWASVMKNSVVLRNILFTDCPDKVLESRLLSRGKNSGRSDDNIKTIRQRIKAFNKQTRTVLTQLKQKSSNLSKILAQKLQIITVNANKIPSQVVKEAKQKLQKHKYTIRNKQKNKKKNGKKNGKISEKKKKK